jgi:AraC-like DNA-binding protein
MNRGAFTMRSCALRDVQAVEACSAHVFPRHTHDAFGIGLIVSGAHRSWSGRGWVEAVRGSIITCNPNEVHDGAPLGDSREWKMLYLAPTLVARIAEDIREDASPQFEFHDPVIENRAQARAFEAAYEALIAPRSDPELAQERLILLFAGLLRRTQRSPPLASRELARVKAWIDDHAAAPLTLAALADEAGLSRFQLVRSFAKLTGFTPHAYIVQRRLDAARAMISRGALLADAAVSCGFADQSHLTRAFVRRYGLTPGAFAQAMR